jgi:hypothetical protein
MFNCDLMDGLSPAERAGNNLSWPERVDMFVFSFTRMMDHPEAFAVQVCLSVCLSVSLSSSSPYHPS